MRSYRELWLWLGAAFLALFAAFIAIGLAYFTKEQYFSFFTCWESEASVAAFIFGFACFAGAIVGTPFPPWAKVEFPNINLEIYHVTNQVIRHRVSDSTDYLPYDDSRVLTYRIRVTNLEAEQNASLTFSLFLKLVPGSRAYLGETRGFIPDWPLDPSLGLDKIRMPIILAPGTSVGGDLIYEISPIDLTRWPTIAQPTRVRFRIDDHISGQRRDLMIDGDLASLGGYGAFGRDDMLPSGFSGVEILKEYIPKREEPGDESGESASTE
jgi:hypothetical protein